MLWRNPSFFWLLWAVVGLAVLLAWAYRRRRALLAVFAAAPLIERLTPNVDQRRRWWRSALRLVALVLLVVALAGPKWGFHWEEVQREGIDVLVALDTSRSMLATDVKPNRLERAKLAVLDMTSLLDGDRIGLVAFAGSAFLECPLTLDYAAFERSLRSVEVGLIPRGGTALARAIETSLAAFEARQGRYEALILITDGEDHEGDLDAAVSVASEHGVKIFTVGIGTTEGELVPVADGKQGFVKNRQGEVVKSRLDEESLRKIAIDTGGAYVRGLGPALGLDEVFRDHIAKMERREVSSSLEKRYEDRFQIPLLLALLLLLVENLLGDRRSGRRTARTWLLRRRGSRSEVAPRGKTQAAGQRVAVLLVALLPGLVGWLDAPRGLAGEGNQLFDSGEYAAATEKYGQGLVDTPESLLLQFNMAAALYKEGRFGEAIGSLNRVLATGQPEWIGRSAYNLGNAQFRLGVNAEESDPQAALASYQEALTSYKRAISADSSDEDAKFNHEFVTRKLEELQEKLAEQEQEEQEQEQEQEQQEQEEQEPQEGEEEQEEQQQEQEEQEPQEGQEEQQEQQEQGGEEQPEPEPQEQEQEQADSQPGEDSQQQAAGEEEEQPTADQQAAQAVLDTAREEELGPEDMQRQRGVAGVGEALEDW